MCACVVAAHACECVCPDCVCSTVRWGADLRAILRHIWVTVLFSVYVCRLRFFRGLGLDRPNRCGHICDTGQVLRTDPPRSSTHVSRARKIEKVLPGAGKGPSQFHMALWYGAFASRRRVKAAGACSTVLVGARGQRRKRFANRFNSFRGTTCTPDFSADLGMEPRPIEPTYLNSNARFETSALADNLEWYPPQASA